MSNQIANALIEALNDEYKARASYRYVIETFGPIRPFIHIVEAESRHIQALIRLFHKYRVSIPPDTWDQHIDKPSSVKDACRLGVEAEIENAGMYDRLLKATKDYPDIQQVMMNLKRASAENHLPAFQRCVTRSTGRCEKCGEYSGENRKRGRRGGRRGHT